MKWPCGCVRYPQEIGDCSFHSAFGAVTEVLPTAPVPPDACWLCWMSLGTTEECPMCALKRLEDAN